MEKICIICNRKFIAKSSKAMMCSMTCKNKRFYHRHKDDYAKLWSNYYKEHKVFLLEKSRKRYFKDKKENYKYLRAINQKAQAKKRFGVLDREEILKRFNNKCCCCGTDKKLAIHHIDGNGRGKVPNNNPNNLEVLCSSCHKIEHNNRRYHGKSTRYSPTL